MKIFFCRTQDERIVACSRSELPKLVDPSRVDTYLAQMNVDEPLLRIRDAAENKGLQRLLRRAFIEGARWALQNPKCEIGE